MMAVLDFGLSIKELLSLGRRVFRREDRDMEMSGRLPAQKS